MSREPHELGARAKKRRAVPRGERTTDDSPASQTLGRFEILGVLGEGVWQGVSCAIRSWIAW